MVTTCHRTDNQQFSWAAPGSDHSQVPASARSQAPAWERTAGKVLLPTCFRAFEMTFRSEVKQELHSLAFPRGTLGTRKSRFSKTFHSFAALHPEHFPWGDRTMRVFQDI